MNTIEFIKLFPKAFKEWIHDRADGLAASIAYYQLMSMPPFIALIVLASSAIFGEQQSREEVEPLITQFFHPQFIIAVKYMLKYSFNLDETKFLTITALAIISLVHGTFGYFSQIKDSIETFWGKTTAQVNIKAAIKGKAEGLFMAGVFFLILTAGFIVGHWFSGMEGILRYTFMLVIEFIVLFSISFFLLVYCPPEKVRWDDALPGAILTTILFMLGRLVLRYFLNRHQATPEDVAATLILYLLWAYYSALVFLYGAEFSKLYIMKRRGS